MATETLAPTPLADVTVQDQLALAQAAASTGSDWAQVVDLLNKTETQLNRLDKQPKATQALFGLLLTEHNLTNNNKPAKQLAHKLYQARIAEVIESITDSFEEQARALDEIDQINQGEWDDRLLAAVPESQRAALIAARTSPSSSKPNSATKQDDKDKDPKQLFKSRKGGRRGNNLRRGGDDDDPAEAIAEEADHAANETVPDSESEAPEPSSKERAKDKDEAGSSRKKDKEGSSPAKARPSTRKSGRKGKQVEVEPETEEEQHDQSGQEEEETKDEEEEEEEQDNDEDEAEEEEEEEEEEDEPEEEEVPVKRGLRERKQSVSTPAPKPPAKSSVVGKRTSKRHQSEATASPPPTAERSSKRLKTEDPTADEVEVTEKDAKTRLARFKSTARTMISTLLTKPNAHGFANPVTDRIAKGYKAAVRRPMSLNEVNKSIRSGTISSFPELQRDVTLVFANAIQFNGQDSELGKQARALVDEFEQLYQIALTTEHLRDD